jgi:hypothetical protein
MPTTTDPIPWSKTDRMVAVANPLLAGRAFWIARIWKIGNSVAHPRPISAAEKRNKNGEFAMPSSNIPVAKVCTYILHYTMIPLTIHIFDFIIVIEVEYKYLFRTWTF